MRTKIGLWSRSFIAGRSSMGPKSNQVRRTNIGTTRSKGIKFPYSMYKIVHSRNIHFVMLMLFISMMTNALSWAFNGEVFAHELDHVHHVLSFDPTAHLEAHQRALRNDEGHLDAATHLCLHAAGQYQPFFLTAPLVIPPSIAEECVTSPVAASIPESILDSPLHPPRIIS